MLYYDRIDFSEGVDVNKTSVSKKNVIFATIGIFWINGLSFNQMSAMSFMMY